MIRSSRLCAAALLCLAASIAAAAPPKKAVDTARYGVYLMKSRVGSLVTRTLDTKYLTKPAIRVDADMEIKSTILGTAVEQSVKTTQLMTPAGRPLTTTYRIISQGRTTAIHARYEPTRVICSVDASGQKSSKVVAIPKGVTLTADPQYAGAQKRSLKVGQKTVMHFFEPLTMTLQKIESEVLKTDRRTVGGKPVRAFMVKSRDGISGESETWVDAEGELLENNSKIGLRIVREDLKAEPSTLAYTPPQDFAVATSLRTEVKLPDARKTTALTLKISRIPDDGVVLSDIRQKVLSREPTGETLSVTYRIESREIPGTTLPLASGTATGPGLGDATYLGTTDPAVKEQADELTAGETDRGLIARRIRAWVKGHMQKPSNVGVPRSAAEIMRSRDGVCRDYATLFAAVARAAGLPTRVCSGIVYFQDAFYYHAWVECQLTAAEDGWYAFDPTLDTDFVDATHVKFAQGDPSDMFSAVRVIGQIQAEILDFE